MFGVPGSVAQFEREIMLERQREGIAKARRDGKYRGRQPTARAKAAEVAALAAAGLSKRNIACRLEISMASVFRILAAQRQAAAAGVPSGGPLGGKSVSRGSTPRIG